MDMRTRQQDSKRGPLFRSETSNGKIIPALNITNEGFESWAYYRLSRRVFFSLLWERRDSSNISDLDTRW
jgi:hypothetical protein